MEKVRIAILTATILLLAGCSFLPNPLRMFKPGAPRQEQKFSYKEAIKVKPKVLRTPEGRYMVWSEVDYAYTSDWRQAERELSLWEKFKRLGLRGILIVVVLGVLALFFPPVAVFLGFAGRATEYGARRIVRGLDKALENVKDGESKKIIYDTLSKELDTKTKLMVAKLKHGKEE